MESTNQPQVLQKEEEELKSYEGTNDALKSSIPVSIEELEVFNKINELLQSEDISNSYKLIYSNFQEQIITILEHQPKEFLTRYFPHLNIPELLVYPLAFHLSFYEAFDVLDYLTVNNREALLMREPVNYMVDMDLLSFSLRSNSYEAVAHLLSTDIYLRRGLFEDLTQPQIRPPNFYDHYPKQTQTFQDNSLIFLFDKNQTTESKEEQKQYIDYYTELKCTYALDLQFAEEKEQQRFDALKKALFQRAYQQFNAKKMHMLLGRGKTKGLRNKDICWNVAKYLDRPLFIGEGQDVIL